MNTMSMMRTVPDSARVSRAGAILPSKRFSGKLMITYSTGPMDTLPPLRSHVRPASLHLTVDGCRGVGHHPEEVISRGPCLSRASPALLEEAPLGAVGGQGEGGVVGRRRLVVAAEARAAGRPGSRGTGGSRRGRARRRSASAGAGPVDLGDARPPGSARRPASACTASSWS